MSEKIGWYVCALVDLLGQDLRLDKLGDFDATLISENESAINKIFHKTYGNVKKFKIVSKDSAKFFSSKMSSDIPCLKLSEFSDLIVLNVSVSKTEEVGFSDINIEGVYFLLLTTAYSFLVMLSKGVALRGGVDIGLGIDTSSATDTTGLVYGNSLSRAYALESKKGGPIRVVVGEHLENFVKEALSNSESNAEYEKYAPFIQKLIIKDPNDPKSYILNYLSDDFRGIPEFKGLYKKAKRFLEKEKIFFENDDKIKEKYSKALEYFDDNPLY